ncbi:MAG: ATP-binding protein [Bacteroidetes bacterium]|nr:ATP-binding protein [Bacteroidota bacterium]
MKCASNIAELYNNLQPHTILFDEKDKDQYVPLYEELLNKLRTEISVNQRKDATFYIAGQSGTGKTTAMNFLPNTLIKKKFDVVYLYGRDLFDPNDVDIIDVLLMFSFKLIEAKKSLERMFYDRLDKIYKKHIGALEEEIKKQKGTSAEVGLEGQLSAGFKFFNWIKAKAEFFSTFKMDSEYRKTTRTFFQFKKLDLLNLCNEIVNKYYENIASGKNLLVIIDDLDKMRDIAQIQKVFIDDRNYMNQIACKKIISIPVHLPSLPQFPLGDASTYFFELKLNLNPLRTYVKKEREVQMRLIDANRELMKRIILQRICKDKKLVDDQSIDLAISKSGGLIRQYIRILHHASLKILTLVGPDGQINESDIENALLEERNLLGRSVIGKERIGMLNDVMNHKTPAQDNNLFIESILGNLILVNQNGDPWYDINPVIESTVKQYGTTENC